MADQIVPLLHRRTDLSTFLIHLTRDGHGGSARDNLLGMLVDKKIEARTCYGIAKAWGEQDQAVADTQRCVCFSEAPLEHTWMLTRDISGRAVPLSQYGLVFTKSYGRRNGVNPVWYLDITPGHTWLTNPVNALIEISRRGHSYRIDSEPPDVTGPLVPNPPPPHDPILRLAPFIEQMGPAGPTKKEFWWEREWRHVGDFPFTFMRIVTVLAPHDEHEGLVSELATATGHDDDWVHSRLRFVDPTWGLERMIAALAGVDDEDAGPFPVY